MLGFEPDGKGRRHTVLAYGIDSSGNILVMDPDPHGRNPAQTTLAAVIKEWKAAQLDMVVKLSPRIK